ncbi:MAG: translocation/assembly module TamB domain-containing protein, partial [Candidatus Thermochlorobacter sp.]
DLVRWRAVDVRDRQGGTLRTSGSVQMSNFEVQQFNIGLNFSKLLLYDKQAGRTDDLIGQLVASSDELRFSGTLAEPMLSGSLRLDRGRFLQYRSGSSKGSQIVEASRFITTIVEEDTSLEARLRRNPKLNLTLDEEFELSETARAIRSAYKSSFVDDMSMSLRVSTVQPLVYTLVFDRFLGEQLENATIEDLALTINKRRLNYRVFGTASITSGRYNFYGVPFEIEPGATMKWFGGGLTDATLDIFARYQVRVMAQTRNELENVVLRPHIAGTVEDPRIEIGYILNERAYKDPSTSLPGEDDPNALLNFVTLLTARQWVVRPGSVGSTLSSGLLASAGLSAGAGLLSTQVTRLASAIQGVQTVNIDFARDRSGQVAGVDFSLEYVVPGTDGKLVLTGSGSTAAVDSLGRSKNAISNSQRLEYRLSRNFVLEAFRNFGPNNFNLFNNAIAEVWGIGISYRESFHTWSELGARWNIYFDAFSRWLSGSKAQETDKTPRVDTTTSKNAVSGVTLPTLNPAPPDSSTAKTPFSGADTTGHGALPPPTDSSAGLRRRPK